ncbi:hypothetical protein DMB95_03250 [Campylobacter sp. MIT 12-8780]|uniref:energy transducer TonB n=1 Tax=unclassified Campylobacter TaxID=2593542 RepID=UPI00115EE0B9|nr:MULTISPECIES: energy transducer TonB [unclassified Campylobacter]NDJ26917.1 energy transducer TonB [Campylobacter sp. MIT 19-121]TQR41938.1 hypothetical protein DMB95_03250 [Campylobacter sp. MIT 12-8780]
MSEQKALIIGIILALSVHLAFLACLLFDFSSRQKEELGGFEADLSDTFQSVMIVANVPLGELKELSNPSQKSLKSDKSEKKTKQEKQKTDKKSLDLEDEDLATLKLNQSKDSKPNNESKQVQSQQQSSQASNLNSDLDRTKKDDFSSAPVQGTSKEASTVIRGSARAQIKSYQGLIMAHLNRFKHYPSEALTKEIQGVALLEIKINAQGEVLSCVLKKSSSETLLDEASLKLISSANPLPKPPAEILKGREVLSFSIPIDYNIKAYYLNKR